MVVRSCRVTIITFLLAWLNSMRLDLQALGLERRGGAALDLNAYLKQAASSKDSNLAPLQTADASDDEAEATAA